MFKWGLFKKDIEEAHLPEELKGMMKSIYSEHSGSDRVVLAMDQLRQISGNQHREKEELRTQIQDLEFELEHTRREINFQADLLTSLCDGIQAPIHTLNQIGDWLDQTHMDVNQRACFTLYRHTARKLQDLFTHIIDTAKAREGVFQLDPIPFQVSSAIREITQTLNFAANEKGIGFQVTIDPDVPEYVSGDIRRLEQILLSLGNNAIKFTYEGEVNVHIQKESDEGGECTLRFLVEDSGVGIPSNQIHTLFDRLAQGDPDIQRNYGGTGLGLYVSKCLVELMGGTIWAENREEGGARFGFSIPFESGSQEELLEQELNLVIEEAETSVESGEPEQDTETESESGTEPEPKRKILVVEDCPDTCRLIERFLEHGPYEVDTVHDGLAALEQYGKKKYDLILMDIQLPELDGVGATMEIRNHERLSELVKTPIVALVGNPEADEGGHYLAGDFDRCLIKPVSSESLLDAISTVSPRANEVS